MRSGHGASNVDYMQWKWDAERMFGLSGKEWSIAFRKVQESAERASAWILITLKRSVSETV